MAEALQDKLRRLRPAAPAPAAARADSSELERLEESLLGRSHAYDALSLKARLERLVMMASRTRGAARIPVEEAAPGRVVENERGRYYLIETNVSLDVRHGDLCLGRLRAVPSSMARVLCGDRSLDEFDLTQSAYLDTETTGLSGGSGTAAFLIGLGFVEGERFTVRQYFMRDYNEESAMLLGLARDLAPFRQIVTFNGKMFDVPLLESRYALQRERFPLEAVRHLDLLHPARRLWKSRLVSCRLQTLEAALLRVRRRGDVPGHEIPRIYFDYIRSRDGRILPRIFEHNRTDIVSLAALTAFAGEWVLQDEGGAEDPRDLVSLGRILDRAGLHERGEAAYRRAAQAGGEARGEALLRLAARAKARSDHEAAVRLWKDAAELGEWHAYRELAVHFEHRRKDPAAALALVEDAWTRCRPASKNRRFERDLDRRRTRLQRKLADSNGLCVLEHLPQPTPPAILGKRIS